jgi:hypothetical protein
MLPGLMLLLLLVLLLHAWAYPLRCMQQHKAA